MLCFTTPMPQVNTLTLFNLAVIVALHWPCQADVVCFDCTTQLLLSPCKGKSLLLLHCYVQVCFSQKFFSCCLHMLKFSYLNKQMSHWLLFVPLCFCFQVLLLLKLFVVVTNFLFKAFLCLFVVFIAWNTNTGASDIWLPCWPAATFCFCHVLYSILLCVPSLLWCLLCFIMFSFLFSDTKNPASKWLINDWLCYLA